MVEDEERLDIILSTTIPRNGASEEIILVTIDYYGSMENRIVGLYKSTYADGEVQR